MRDKHNVFMKDLWSRKSGENCQLFHDYKYLEASFDLYDTPINACLPNDFSFGERLLNICKIILWKFHVKCTCDI